MNCSRCGRTVDGSSAEGFYTVAGQVLCSADYFALQRREERRARREANRHYDRVAKEWRKELGI